MSLTDLDSTFTGATLRDRVNSGLAVLRARFATRAAMVSALAAGTFTPEAGQTYDAGGLAYMGSAGATAISDLPGLVPAGTSTLGHWPDTTAGIAEATAYAAGKGIDVLAAPTGSLPASHTSALDYRQDTASHHYTEASVEARSAKRTLRAQHAGSHADAVVSTLQVETRPVGSSKNGPASADLGQSISIVKKGYAGASRPTAGEIDGLMIAVRQDGPQGLPSADPGSSDAAGILINAQNVGTCGFVCAIEAATSNLNVGGGIAKQVQTKMGTINANGSPAISHGFQAAAMAGANDYAFRADENGGTWTYLMWTGNFHITWAGDVSAKTTDWPVYAWTLARASGVNGAFTLETRGTGTLNIRTKEAAALGFATSDTLRWVISATGILYPNADATTNLGQPANRIGHVYAQNMTLYGGAITLSGLPTANPAVAGRLWNDAGTLKVSAG